MYFSALYNLNMYQKLETIAAQMLAKSKDLQEELESFFQIRKAFYPNYEQWLNTGKGGSTKVPASTAKTAKAPVAKSGKGRKTAAEHTTFVTQERPKKTARLLQRVVRHAFHTELKVGKFDYYIIEDKNRNETTKVRSLLKNTRFLQSGEFYFFHPPRTVRGVISTLIYLLRTVRGVISTLIYLPRTVRGVISTLICLPRTVRSTISLRIY